MITRLTRDGAAIGFDVSGDVTAADYQVLTPAVEAAVDANGSANVLLDLTDFHREKMDAWGSDLRFGREYHGKIERMAIVGDGTLEKVLAKVSSPFFAKESKYFPDRDAAWTWLEG